MADSQFHDISSSPYAYRGVKYWCPGCHRTFSQLHLEFSEPHCPCCQTLMQELPAEGISRRNDASITNTNTPNNNDIFEENHPEVHHETLTLQTNEMNESFNNSEHSNNSINDNQHRENHTPETPTETPTDRPRSRIVLFFVDPMMTEEVFPVFVFEGEITQLFFAEFLRGFREDGPLPASQESLDKLEEFHWAPHHMETEESCPVCQENYKDGETLVKLNCKHDYHKECVLKWLTQHNACPMCRQSI